MNDDIDWDLLAYKAMLIRPDITDRYHPGRRYRVSDSDGASFSGELALAVGISPIRKNRQTLVTAILRVKKSYASEPALSKKQRSIRL